jgi:hypothetical protein
VRSVLVAVVAAIATLTMAIGPVAAATGDRGSVVQCSYKLLGEDSPYWGGKLVHIDVTPPKMYSLSAGAQTVAWRFTVERINFESQSSPDTWKRTYVSPRQYGSATGSTAAAFTAMGVGVSLPRVDDWNDVYYRVNRVLFWYRPNDTVQKKVIHKMVHYENIIDGEHAWNDSGDYSCPGGHSAYTD